MTIEAKYHLPQAWEEVQLADVTEKGAPIVYGIVQAGPHIEGGVPYIKSADVGSEIDVGNLACTSEEIAKKYVRAECKPGDLIFSLRGNIGELSFVPQHLVRANLTQGTARIRISDAYSPVYISNYLQSERATTLIKKAAKGSTFQEISLDQLRKLPIAVPPFPEQRRIASILSQWDDSLSILSQLIDVKRQQKRGLAKQLLTGKRRLPGFEGEWENTELLRVLKESRIPAKDEVGKRITVSLHLKGVSLREERDTSEVGKTTYYRRSAGQFIYGKQNLFKGALGIVPEYLDGYLSSQDLPAFDVSKEYCTDFIYEYFARTNFYESLEKMSTGTGSKRIHPEAIYKLCVFFPPLAEQHAIADVLSTLNAEIASLEALKAKVAEQKRGLMNALLTGRVRVKMEEAS